MKAALLVVLSTCFEAVTWALVLSKEYPVTKVVKLLEDMKEQLEKEADADEEIYDKLACWCETNDKAKTKAITDAEARITQLTNSILSLTASNEALKVGIASLQKEIAANEKALATATALREKASEEFNDEEKEMIQSIKALDAAIIVLSKHNTPKSAVLAEVRATINAQFKKHGDLLLGVITPSQKRAIMSFAQQQGSDYFDSSPTFNQAYAPQSSTIFGILTQMKETFESDLSQDQKDEIAAQKSFKDLKEAKEKEISTGKSVLESKVQLLASQTQGVAQAKEDRDDTSATLSADEKYLMDLKKKCSMTDQEWEERQKTRQDEVAAITKAIEMLSTDDARDLFDRTLNPTTNVSFFQDSLNNRDARDHAADALQVVAVIHNNPKMSALAAAVRLNAFTQVIKAIDDMVAELSAEKAEEIKLRDYCIDELAKKDRGTQAKTHEKGVTEQTIESLKMKSDEIQGEIDALKKDISDLNAQMEEATKIRKAEAATFKSVTADQAATQALLQKAIKTLTDVYKTSLLQQHRNGTSNVTIPAPSTASPPPPEDFSTYKLQGGASPVIALLEHILNNVVNMETEVRVAERESQDEYTEFKQTTTEAIQAKEDSVTNKVSVKAKTLQDKIEAEKELGDIGAALVDLADEVSALHKQCDYTLNNFDVRQQARDEEVEALRQAKAFLEGMKV